MSIAFGKKGLHKLGPDKQSRTLSCNATHIWDYSSFDSDIGKFFIYTADFIHIFVGVFGLRPALHRSR